MEHNVSMNLGVDAGNISVLDLDYIKENGGVMSESRLRMALTLKPLTKYTLHVTIPETWDNEDPIQESIEILTGPSGTILIGDACYHWPDHDKWMAFLKKTSYLEAHPDDKGFSINTGGDGEFKVSVRVEA